MALPGLFGRKKPIVLRTQSMERAAELMALCDDRGIKAIVGVEPDKPEDISDLERKLDAKVVVRGERKVGRNEQCPCGSGKKYKKCCYAGH